MGGGAGGQMIGGAAGTSSVAGAAGSLAAGAGGAGGGAGSAPVGSVLSAGAMCHVAVEAEFVYWVRCSDTVGVIGRVLKTGGPSTDLYTGEATSLAVQDGFIYWTVDGGLFRGPASGGTPAKLLSTSPILDLAVDVSGIYLLLKTEIVHTDLLGQGMVTLTTIADTSSLNILLTSKHVNWVETTFAPEQTSLTRALRRVPKGGGTSVTVATVPADDLQGGNPFGALAWRPGFLYWAPPPGIHSFDLATGIDTPLFAETSMIPAKYGERSLGADDTQVYWVSTAAVALRAIPVGGGEPKDLANVTESVITRFVVDTNALFVADAAGLLRVHK
jgi:hypothetical protein